MSAVQCRGHEAVGASGSKGSRNIPPEIFPSEIIPVLPPPPPLMTFFFPFSVCCRHVLCCCASLRFRYTLDTLLSRVVCQRSLSEWSDAPGVRLLAPPPPRAFPSLPWPLATLSDQRSPSLGGLGLT